MLKKLLSIGRQKEQQAEAWLKKQKIKIIAQNFTCKGGEIDLIGLTNEHPPLSKICNPKNSEPILIFFEVKYRKNSLYGHPAEFVTPQKQQRIIHSAELFLLKHPKLNHHAMRFDVITFEGDQKEPDWIQDAFGV
ncbi:MAG: putative endonuclease [Thiomicrorhabdus sp.]|nr:MAG: putative endonuclease [Thiomicrorhabdus sp.]